MCRAGIVLLLVALSQPAASDIGGADTGALDRLVFGEASTVRATDRYRTTGMALPSLNAGLWSKANVTQPERRFSSGGCAFRFPPEPCVDTDSQVILLTAASSLVSLVAHRSGQMESVLNLSASASCTSTVKLLPAKPGAGGKGVATLPCAADAASALTTSLGTANGLTLDECKSHCCSQLNCSAFAWYDTAKGLLCSTFTQAHILGPQPFGPGTNCRTAQGGQLTVAAAAEDQVANGLRSGTWLGGVGTGGYEIRADGTFHLSTIRNQSPAAEPWQGIVRDLVLAVSVDGEAHVVRLKPFGNLSAVPQIIYDDAFPVARLRFLGNLTLFAYGLITPGDSNTSNTPTVVFTLRTTNDKPDETPMNISFMVAGGVFRNDWRQVAPPLHPAPGNLRTRAACAAACTAAPQCYAWQFPGNGSCFFDSSSYAQGANLPGTDSGLPGNFTYSSRGVSFTTRVLGPSPQVPTPPPAHHGAQCRAAPAVPGEDITGTSATRTSVADGQPGLDDCRSSCCNMTDPPCNGWVVADKTAPAGAHGSPCAPGRACCWMMAGLVKSSTGGTPWATSSVGTPGQPPAPTTHELHNALGSEGFFVPAGQDAGVTAGSGSAVSIEALLAVLMAPLPAQALSDGGRQGAPDELFQAAAATASHVAPGDSVSLSVAHAWRFPHYYWYRDTHGGTDNGVRYTLNFQDVEAVAASIQLKNVTQNLGDWQSIYAGLPSPLLRDASFNLFNHIRSAIWHREDNQYRQWESYEFADYMNPTNGDERHVPYFNYLPETMRSKLLTEVNLLQEPTGMFPCVVVSAAHNNQKSDPCAGQTLTHPDDITMMLIAAHEQYALANDTALITAIYPKLMKAFGFYQKYYDTAPWSVPFLTHETYDAVKESATVTGEGNLGSSLYNAVNYLLGLHIVRELAGAQSDAATVKAAQGMIAKVQSSIQRNFWQPAAGFYIGDTVHMNTYLLEQNGWSYHSSDDLHGQVLAYRLGFGDLLPRKQMQLHQQYILRDLRTEWGLQFDDYSKQNWLMSDHSHASLLLRWNEVGGWDTSLRQIQFWRDQKHEMTKNTAVIDTNTGTFSG